MSTSYGLPQLMGFNWQVTRHPGVRAMVLAFQDSCEEQVAGFFNFVAQNGLTPYILNADWRGFTRRYNGPGNVEAYAGGLIRALKVVNTPERGRGQPGCLKLVPVNQRTLSPPFRVRFFSPDRRDRGGPTTAPVSPARWQII